MKKKRRYNKHQIIFGTKCVLIAIAIIVSALDIMFYYLFPNTYSDSLRLVIQISSLVVATVVMIYEIVPYVQLTNEGIQNIYQERDIQIANYGKFSKIIDNNELLYKFQPIVSAKDGSIYAFESLMRTKSEIGLAPRDILKYAEISQKLYEIEYYTFYNTLRIYNENRTLFAGRKVFINSIPSIILSDEHLRRLKKEFDAAAKNCVVEILEDSADTEESLAAFSKIQELFGCQIAIDDYGSGYSNESKLLCNNPNYIKIDMTLITSIESDRKKQFLVSNIISFASKYGIKVLAEGVETKEELQTLIELGVDLLQGFYLARPDSEIISEINPEVKRFIISENIRLAKYNNSLSTYEASENETIRLLDIALDKYTTVLVKNGTVNLIGEPEHTIEMLIKTAPGSDCIINLENVNIKGYAGTTIQVGSGAKLELNLIGKNTLHKEGISVPEGSELSVTGDGSLYVYANRNDGVSIGSSFTEPFGSITFASAGLISINSSGDRVVSVGGGIQGENTTINLLKGKIDIVGYGIKAVGIGAVRGKTSILTFAAQINIDINANEAVGIGTMCGNVNIVLNSDAHTKLQGEKIVGIGVFENGGGSIALAHGRITTDIHGAEAVCIGSFDSNVEISCSSEYTLAYGEGRKVCGIGNRNGGGKVMITAGAVKSYILAADPCWFGTEGKNIIVTGGCVFGGDEGIFEAVNSFGEPLKKLVVEGEKEYVRHIITHKGDYVYRAEKPDEEKSICVFVPVECEIRNMEVNT